MRAINLFAALSGLLALAMLSYGAHAIGPGEAFQRIELAGFIQLAAAAAGLAIANRTGLLNRIGGVLILGGAAIFAGALYAISFTNSMSFAMGAPVGGIATMAGWFVLAFAKPS